MEDKIVKAFCWIFFVVLGLAPFYFHKPAYHGRIIDHETKEPLEGVVVVTIYGTTDAFGGPGGPYSRDIGAQETLTDKNGFFTIPSYTRLTSPIAHADATGFIIFKPGYSSSRSLAKVFPRDICLNNDSHYFPAECSYQILFTKEIGSKEVIIRNPSTKEKITITNGILELVKLRTWEERRDANVSSWSEFELPIFKKMAEKNYEEIWSH